MAHAFIPFPSWQGELAVVDLFASNSISIRMRGMKWSFLWMGIFLMHLTHALKAQDYLAGVAVRDVTPSPLLPVSGGVGPSNPVTEQRGNLTVRAFALQHGASTVVFVSSDFLGFPAALGNRVRAKVKWLPADHILIGATHTHSAPDCYGFPDGKGGNGANPSYWNFVCDQMAGAIHAALACLSPVKLKINTGEARGKIAYNAYAEQLYDPRCHVIQASSIEGKPMVTLVNYAVHPEVLGANVGICSPDLVWPLTQRIEMEAGGVAMFMNSALGGMVTADNRKAGAGDSRTWDECLRIGTLLADQALEIVDEANEQTSAHLKVHTRRIQLPIDSNEMLAILKSSPLDFELDANRQIETTINLIELGNAQILTIPGEALPNIGYYLKRQMKGDHNLLFGLTNDAFGYIMTRVDWGSFRRYGYITRTSLGERTGEIVISESLKLIDQSE